MICRTAPGSGKGEHVWPAWYLGDRDAAGPPGGGWAKNGAPLLGRGDLPLNLAERQRVFVPACESCNNDMDRRVEKPAKEVIRRLYPNAWGGSATHAEWQAIGVWFAKVMLLLGHGDARWTHPKVDESAIRFDGKMPDLEWLADEGQALPDGLSVWVFRTDGAPGESTYRVVVPRRVKHDGGEADFHFLLLVENGLCVTMLWHPGWDVTHPLEERGYAWELLHGAPPVGGDLSTLPVLPWKTIQWPAYDMELQAGQHLDGSLAPLADGRIPELPIDLVSMVSRTVAPSRSSSVPGTEQADAGFEGASAD